MRFGCNAGLTHSKVLLRRVWPTAKGRATRAQGVFVRPVQGGPRACSQTDAAMSMTVNAGSGWVAREEVGVVAVSQTRTDKENGVAEVEK